MSYLGNSPPSQNFVAGADQFSGTGSQTVFTLSRNVNTVFDIFVTVSNVPQDPFTAYTVAGNTLTFDGAPASGTNNIDVVYRATNVQTFVPSPGVSAQFGLGSATSPSITFIGDTNTGIYSPAADTIAFAEGGAEVARFDSAGNFGIGTSSPTGFGTPNLHINGTNPLVHFTTPASGTASGDGSQMGQGGLDFDIYNFEAGRIGFGTSGAERMRIDSSGNVGIGTSSPGGRLDVVGTVGALTNAIVRSTDSNMARLTLSNSNRNWTISNYGAQFSPNGALVFADETAGSSRAWIDTSGNFAFNSGYGSPATAYGCRAWVNFNGTGTVAIRASGNVSSITDGGVGVYTVNFTNALPDANYSWSGLCGSPGVLNGVQLLGTPTTSNVPIITVNTGFSVADFTFVTVSVFR